MAPSSAGGAEDLALFVPASKEASQGRPPKMEEALAGSSLPDSQRALAGTFLESLRVMESRGEVAFFKMLSGFKVSFYPKLYSVV